MVEGIGPSQLWGVFHGLVSTLLRIVRGAARKQAGRAAAKSTIGRCAVCFSLIEDLVAFHDFAMASRPENVGDALGVLAPAAIWTLPIELAVAGDHHDAVGHHSFVVANVQDHKGVLGIHRHDVALQARRNCGISLVPTSRCISSVSSSRLLTRSLFSVISAAILRGGFP